jgi:hypothetical protein
MTRFTVVYLASALDELAEIWIESADKNEVAIAANTIDRLLAINPNTRGFPFRESERQLAVPPLRVVFTIYDDDRLVRISRVART